MAQTPLSQQLPGSLTDGLGSVASPRSWMPAMRTWLRDNLLPDDDHHDPVSVHVARSAAVPAHPAHRFARMLPTVIVALVSVLLVAAIALFVFRAMYSDRIYPAVVVGDVNVGGLTTAEAESVLTERAADLEQGTIAFTYNGMTWTPALSDLGATVNLEKSIAAAEHLGRGGDAASRLEFTGEILRSDQVVPLQTQVDMAILNAWFDRVDSQINNPAVNAQIVVDGTNVSISPDATGIVVDRKAATAQILSTLATLEPMRSELPVAVDQPEIMVSDLEQVKFDVQTAIAKPVRIGFEEKAWRIDGSTLSSYLTVETVLEDGAPRAVLSMDTERLAADLRTQFVPEVNREPVNARIGWNDEKGRVVALDPSVTGVTLKATAFAEAVAASYLGDHGTVKIPVVITRPTIDAENLAALNINARLGHGDSNFAGGAWGRDQNIYVATDLLNGTLVPPGGEFSFNQAIGEITADKGYQEAAVVVAEEVGRDIGGGVCQVSTTIFRAAIYAGMPITEWHPHTYRLTNYERDGWGPGFDASILQNEWQTPDQWADFRFENFTDGWLLVEAYTADVYVNVNIYGQETGRSVDVTWWGINGGKNTGFTRVIYDADKNEIARRDFASDFK
jgi:vancomycin resistance protein YoaR